ncbi:unnamed protein product [Aphis gossypii]|uniref:Uncharacterized protein n=1 Tax=Aphis gossypii TaxID=80765 RepID=A0A9P0IYM1_APHGO|nr:unnamed protein product [Aphis gossypii]
MAVNVLQTNNTGKINNKHLALIKIVKIDHETDVDVYSPAFVSTTNICVVNSGPASQEIQFQLMDGNNEIIVEFTLSYSVKYFQVSNDTYAINLNNHTYMLKFKTDIDLYEFTVLLGRAKKGNELSLFSNQTDEASAAQYFQNFDLDQEENMNVDNKFLRKDYYCYWANTKAIDVRFRKIVHDMKNFFIHHVIVVDMDSNNYNGDILFSFIGKKNPKSPQFGDFEPLNIQPSNVMIFDHCLNQQILIGEDILNKFDRQTACSNVKALGYQHIHRHNIIESDTSDSTIYNMFTSSSDDIFEEPEKKKQKIKIYKTCQMKIFRDCNNLLFPHNDNCTQLTGTKTKLEVLILCPQNSKTICQKLATHLGLIFIEDMFGKMEENTKNKKFNQNVNQKHGKVLYPLFQNYVARSLMLGCNNISLTCDLAIFKNMNSNVKCMIFSEKDSLRYITAKPLINMFVQTKNDTFVDYLSAISEIIDFTVKCKVSISAIYSISDKFYNCNVPAVGIVPFYILKFFAEKKMAEENVKKSLF